MSAPTYPYVFHGGPLDGHEIRAVRRTAIYRDEAGEPLPVATGDRRATKGGLYELDRRPMRTAEDGRIVRHPGRYCWTPPKGKR